jgi:hypothetical protein
VELMKNSQLFAHPGYRVYDQSRKQETVLLAAATNHYIQDTFQPLAAAHLYIQDTSQPFAAAHLYTQETFLPSAVSNHEGLAAIKLPERAGKDGFRVFNHLYPSSAYNQTSINEYLRPVRLSPYFYFLIFTFYLIPAEPLNLPQPKRLLCNFSFQKNN